MAMSIIEPDMTERSRRAAARRTALLVGLVAVAVYVTFMVMAVNKAL
jgi:hypothetical protein